MRLSFYSRLAIVMIAADNAKAEKARQAESLASNANLTTQLAETKSENENHRWTVDSPLLLLGQNGAALHTVATTGIDSEAEAWTDVDSESESELGSGSGSESGSEFGSESDDEMITAQSEIDSESEAFEGQFDKIGQILLTQTGSEANAKR